jgi:hypothetical protein
MTRNTPTPRTARRALRMVLLAAAMGAAYACGSATPTSPAATAAGASHDDNSGYMGSGYNTTPPDSTQPPHP